MARLHLPLLGAFALAAAATGLAGCGSTKTASNNTGFTFTQSNDYFEWWNQQIVFHTDSNVYFDPWTQSFYWFQNGQWTESSSPPRHATLNRASRKVVTRSHLLEASGKSPMVQAFNPYFEEPIDPVLEAADALIEYDDMDSVSVDESRQFDFDFDSNDN